MGGVVVLNLFLVKKKGGWETQVHAGSNREVSFGGVLWVTRREGGTEGGRDMQGAPV